MKKDIALFGCGNMVQAIFIPMYEINPKLSFYTYTPNGVRALYMAEKTNGKQLDDLSVIPKVDIYVIGCKPQQFDELAKQLKSKLDKDSIVLSMMAAVEIQSIQDKLDHHKVARLMPNTPITVKKGVNLFTFSSEFERFQKEELMLLFYEISKNHPLDTEEELDKLTVVSGSGPAYLFNFAHHWLESIVDMGIDRKKADQIIRETFLGASTLMQTHEDLLTLRENVTSKGGVTFEALKVFNEDDQLAKLTNKAFKAALDRMNGLK